MKRVSLDTTRIKDRDSFHDEFARAFGFPDFYGRNMNAWIDCMSYLDEPESGMTSIPLEKGEPIVLDIPAALEFKTRCRELFDDLIECSAFVNKRFVDSGDIPILSLMFVE